jgi:hypothetical protein
MDELAEHESEYHDGGAFPILDASDEYAAVNAGAAIHRVLKPGCVARAACRRSTPPLKEESAGPIN